MSPDYLARLFQQRSQSGIIRFDEQAVSAATLADLSEELWRRFETRQSATDSRAVFLHKLGLARQDEDSEWRPTMAPWPEPFCALVNMPGCAATTFSISGTRWQAWAMKELGVRTAGTKFAGRELHLWLYEAYATHDTVAL